LEKSIFNITISPKLYIFLAEERENPSQENLNPDIIIAETIKNNVARMLQK
jgi:hypothetical protein